MPHKDPIKRKKYFKEYDLKRKEKRKQYHLNNKEKRKQYRLDNKEKIKEVNRKYFLNNREKIKEYLRKYKLNNKPKMNAYVSNKRKTDLVFGLTSILRSRLGQALNGKSKSKRTLELLGCTVEYLIQHLEKQFQHGMTWENRHLFHIDHIRPCSSFDLTDIKQQSECFNYKNLQPLWAYQNLSKGSKYNGADK